jgi:hypothetical protein
MAAGLTLSFILAYLGAVTWLNPCFDVGDCGLDVPAWRTFLAGLIFLGFLGFLMAIPFVAIIGPFWWWSSRRERSTRRASGP